MGGDHPIAWYHEFEGGRSWYTGGGHTSESYTEDLFRKHLEGGILWAAGAADTAPQDATQVPAGGATTKGATTKGAKTTGATTTGSAGGTPK